MENRECIGGCRNPATAVAKNQSLRSVGRSIARWFSAFVVKHPQALLIGERYGSANYEGPPPELEHTFREGLRKLLGLNQNPRKR